MKPGDLVIVSGRAGKTNSVHSVVMTQMPGAESVMNPITGHAKLGSVGLVLTASHTPDVNSYGEEIFVLFSGPVLGWCMMDMFTLA